MKRGFTIVRPGKRLLIMSNYTGEVARLYEFGRIFRMLRQMYFDF